MTKKDEPLISVIVPIYNTANYLHQCLESIINQAYRNLEIILIDDGSTDDSGKIADEYAANDMRIQVIHQKNLGKSAAKNNGLDIANGEYITFVDSDDWLEPNIYEKLIHEMTTNEADLVACGYYMEYEDKTVIPQNEYEVSKDIFGRKELFEYVYIRDRYRGFTSWMPMKLFRKELVGDIRFDESIGHGEDLLFFMSYASKVKKAKYLEMPLYHYRQVASSATHSANIHFAYEIVDVYEQMINFCEVENIEPEIIPWLQRFAVYRAILVARLAIKQNDQPMLKKCQDMMNKYRNVYIEHNQEHTDRINELETLLEYKMSHT